MKAIEITPAQYIIAVGEGMPKAKPMEEIYRAISRYPYRINPERPPKNSACDPRREVRSVFVVAK